MKFIDYFPYRSNKIPDQKQLKGGRFCFGLEFKKGGDGMETQVTLHSQRAERNWSRDSNPLPSGLISSTKLQVLRALQSSRIGATSCQTHVLTHKITFKPT